MPLALATKHLAPQHCKNTKHALHGKLYMYDLEDSSALLGASHVGVYVAKLFRGLQLDGSYIVTIHECQQHYRYLCV